MGVSPKDIPHDEVALLQAFLPVMRDLKRSSEFPLTDLTEQELYLALAKVNLDFCTEEDSLEPRNAALNSCEEILAHVERLSNSDARASETDVGGDPCRH